MLTSDQKLNNVPHLIEKLFSQIKKDNSRQLQTVIDEVTKGSNCIKYQPS